jgi:hypothetical protein
MKWIEPAAHRGSLPGLVIDKTGPFHKQPPL